MVESFGRKLTPEEEERIATDPDVSTFLFGADEYYIVTSGIGVKNSRLWTMAIANGHLPEGFETPDDFIEAIKKFASNGPSQSQTLTDD